MSDLIARLEKASEGSRELDRAILDCTDPLAHVLRPPLDSPILPHYTTSIDAALTLVPSVLGIMWDVAKYPGESAAAYVGPANVPVRAFVTASTPALALCIAALRARGVTP